MRKGLITLAHTCHFAIIGRTWGCAPLLPGCHSASHRDYRNFWDVPRPTLCKLTSSGQQLIFQIRYLTDLTHVTFFMSKDDKLTSLPMKTVLLTLTISFNHFFNYFLTISLNQ